MTEVNFRVIASDNEARAGQFRGSKRQFDTPVFMPVGTRGTVRLLPSDELARLGYEILLSNTYHLMLRPGAETVERLGGLHRFCGWEGAMLTDSGGFQVMSLDAKFSNVGATFRSVYDGSWVTLTPEEAVGIQERLGADIAMVLDVCTMLPASRDVLSANSDLTTEWARRCRLAKSSSDQAQFGIIQGGVDLSLREKSSSEITAIDFEGFAIGGLAVGEERIATLEAIEATLTYMPKGKPRYLMGVGDPYTLAHAIGLGVDMFDCVAPSRLGRHGIALTSKGRRSIKRAEYRDSGEPLDGVCSCTTCARYSRGFMHHLFKVDPQSLGTLLTRHNLAFMAQLISQARSAIVGGHYEKFLKEIDLFWS